MAILDILTAPDPRLKKKSLPVAAVDDQIRRELDDMVETMYAAKGIGLAAPQVGILKRMLVVNVEQHEKGRNGRVYKIINPEITWKSAELSAYKEGCLSVPAQFDEITRPEFVKISYLDENGAQQEIESGGLLATCVQHEIDHLDGILFIDYLSQIKRSMIIRRIQKDKRFKEFEAAAEFQGEAL